MADYIKRWYINLYTTDMKDSQRKVWDILNWPVRLSEEEAQALALSIEEREKKDGLWALKAFKVLRLGWASCRVLPKILDENGDISCGSS